MADTDPKPPFKRPALNLLVVGIFCLLMGFLGGAMAVRLFDIRLGGPATPQQQAEIVLSESALISDIAERLKPSVVSISVQTVERGFFSQLFTQEGAGTGIIVNDNGLVLTNRHVIPESVTSVSVVTTDGTVYEDVEVVDRDPLNDIAFLRIGGGQNLKAAPLGDSDKMRVGDKVVAIGNALGEFDNTVTSGIISGTGRPIVAGDGASSEQLQNLFQTDAAINPGNSGGPLVNMQGEVIGINTAVAGGAENIGFAIPINDVKPVLASVQDSGEIIRPYLGVRYVMLTPTIAAELEAQREQGALITASGNQPAVLNDSPADKAGLQESDIIIQIDGEDLTSQRPLSVIIGRHRVGDVLSVKYVRDGQEQILKVTLEEILSG
jgi:serine protease Do